MAKQSRKELLKQDDAFLTAAHQGAEWISRHRVAVIGGGVGLFVVVAGVIFANELTTERDAWASERLFKAQAILGAEVVDEGAAPDGDPPTFPSTEARDEAAQATLMEVIDKVGSNGVGVLAHLYLAEIYQRGDKKAEAEAALRKVVSASAAKSGLRFIAVERLVYVLENSGDIDGALSVLKQTYSSGWKAFGDRLLIHQARLYQRQGKPEDARALLQKVVDTYPESSLRTEVQAQLQALGPEASEPQAASGVPAEERP